MKKVLFIGIANLDFEKKEQVSHLRKKFEGLSRGMNPFVLAKGSPFYKKIWGTEFYLLSPGFLFWPLAFFLAFYLCLIKKIDTIVAQSPLIEGFVGVILKTFFQKELIVEIHGDWKEGPFLSKKRKFVSFQKKAVPILAKFSLRRADKIRAISNFTKKEAMKISGQKPYFLSPTFTDIDIFLKEKDTFFDNFVLFVGFLSPIKNVSTLIDSFLRVEKEFPSFKLVIIGDGAEKQNLESRVKRLGLKKKVEFKGRLSLEDTKEIMKRCYCLVLPSFSEGLGRVLMEAMALKKPVLGSNVEGIPDLIKDGQNGFLFDPNNTMQLAMKIRTLLSDRALAVKMGESGRKFVENNFSNQKYVENYISMINS